MGKIILVTGGARSGKSSYAQQMAENVVGKRIYLATCPSDQSNDPEMQSRIDKHIEARKDRGWLTVEEPLTLAEVIDSHRQADVIMVDCLTLWISNLMHISAAGLTDSAMAENCREFLEAANGYAGILILVSNEVGLGIVPENVLARRYRDLVGLCNQLMAVEADEVFLVCCGLPLRLKG